MDIFIKIPIAAVVSITVLFFISKLIGNRQISEMSLFDYINSITVGSIAAELAASDTLRDSVRFLIAAVVYGFVTFCFALISNKSRRIRGFLEGEPIILMRSGVLYRESFKRAHIDLNEFQMHCRVLGYFDISDIDTVILEANGKMSIIPKSAKEPLTVEAAGLTAKQEHLPVNAVMDGRILTSNLLAVGKDAKWLKAELAARGIDRKNVFLATVDENGELTVFTSGDSAPQNPI